MDPFKPPKEFIDFMSYWERPNPKTMEALALVVNGLIEDRTQETRSIVLECVENAYATLSITDLTRFWLQYPQYLPDDPSGVRPFTEWMLARLRDPAVKSYAPSKRPPS